MEMTPKKAYWNEILTGGFVLGLLYAVQIFVVYLLDGKTPFNWLFFLYGISVIAYCQLYFGRRIAVIRDVEGKGYSYLSALGNTVKILLLSGFVVGFASWLVQNVIDPAYGALLQRQATEQALAALPNATSEQVELARTMARAMTSIWGLIGVSMLSMLFNGVLIGLVTSAFIKRNPNIFSQND